MINEKLEKAKMSGLYAIQAKELLQETTNQLRAFKPIKEAEAKELMELSGRLISTGSKWYNFKSVEDNLRALRTKAYLASKDDG